MRKLLEDIHSTKVVMTTPKGGTIKSTLCATMDEFTDEYGAVSYLLLLHPILCHNVKKNFAEFPQDFMKRLTQATKRKTPSLFNLARLLSMQDKRKPFVRNISQLIKELDLENYYNKERGKTEKQIIGLLETMKKIELLSSYEIQYKTERNKEVVSKIICYLNDSFVKRLGK